MSRVHSTQNNNNSEIPCHMGDSFFYKMMKNRRPMVQTDPRTRQEVKVRDRSLNRPPTAMAIARPAAKTQIVTKNEPELRRRPSAQELVHKEVFNNNMATVEVTVRTVAPKGGDSKPLIEEIRDPWDKILSRRKSEDTVQGNFGNFDPLRTLHFLSKELEMKLQNMRESDPSVQQIVADMQNAMQRLPPDVLQQMRTTEQYNYAQSNGTDYEPVNIKKNSSEGKVSKYCQTVIIGDAETKKMQQQLEDSASKLEASCKEMEGICSKLRKERDDLEAKLLAERETVVSLKKELQDCVSEKDGKMNKEIKRLSSERDLLKRQINELQAQVETKTGQTAEDVRSLVEELRTKHVAIEQENTARKNELTMMKLERDKMNVLLESRDKQLRELRSELETIQSLVSSQISEFRTKPTFSSTSTMSSVSQIWKPPSATKTHKVGNSIHELFLNNDVMRRMLLSKELQIAESGTITTLNADEIIKEQQNLKLELDKRDEGATPRDHVANRMKESQMTISDIGTEVTEFMNDKVSASSIKDLFAEIKRQAFNVSLPSPPAKLPDATTETPNVLGSRASSSS